MTRDHPWQNHDCQILVDISKPLHLKKMIPALLLLGCCSACTHHQEKLVDHVFVDSLIAHYTSPFIADQNEKELLFWKSRIRPTAPGYLNESRYAGCLSMQFRFSGDIDSLVKADSILLKVDRDFNHKETSADIGMVSHCVTRHRFAEADSFLQKAKRLGLRPYESLVNSFDVDFELGRYTEARVDLNGIVRPDDYGYWFRRSKLHHLDGELDSAIDDMLRAAALTNGNDYLKGVALANAGDLYLHAGDLAHARDVYVRCVRLNSSDFHSLMGLGWIAVVHDGDDAMAGKIFHFVQSHSRLPDPLFKLTQAAEARHDTVMQRRWAATFARQATAPVYGRMYNKYLIQLYTGILHQPALAESIAADELKNRATPQTYAWYVRALFSNNKKDEAYRVYEQHVSGRPLEALELYWMGRMMEGLDKNYNATAFYTAAEKTRYDLDPADAEYIQEKLSE
jgi:hypothetical protein